MKKLLFLFLISNLLIGAAFVYEAKVLKVLDGDTLEVEIDLGFGIIKRDRVRVYGIDTPEIHTKNLAEKALGLKSKAALEECVSRGAKFQPTGKDKYGRMLGNVWCADGELVSDYLIRQGLARPYFGEKKEAWVL